MLCLSWPVLKWCGLGSSTYSGRAGVRLKVGEAEPGEFVPVARSTAHSTQLGPSRGANSNIQNDRRGAGKQCGSSRIIESWVKEDGKV